MKIKRLQTPEGFTIVELMIALSILATILVMSTVIMMSIGKMYAKGANLATLQNASRNVSAELTSAIQFSGSTPKNTCKLLKVPPECPAPGGPHAICIGLTRYSYILDRKLGTDHLPDGSTIYTPHVLWRDTMSSPDVCAPVDLTVATPSANGYELIPENVRLSELVAEETTPESGIYKVTVRTAYGDTDLLNASRTGCQGAKGNEYCGASRISTTVTRRIQ